MEIDGDVCSRVVYKTIFDQKRAIDVSKEHGNMVLLGITENYILWSHLRKPLEKGYNNINGISVLDLGYDLWVYDLMTKKNYKLEKDCRGDYRYSKEYIVWEKRSIIDSNQGFNICFASVPPQPIGQMESKGELPIEMIVDADIVGAKVKEIRCQGDQVVKKVIGDVMFLSSLENLHRQEWKDYILNLSNLEGCEFNKNQPSSQALNILKKTNRKIAWQKENNGSEVIVYNPEDNSVKEYKNNNLRDRRIVGQYDGKIIYIVDDNYDSNIFVYYPETNEDIAVGNDESLWIKLLFDDSIYVDSQIIYQFKNKGKTQHWVYDITNKKRIKIGETVVGYSYSKSSKYLCLVEVLLEVDPNTKENKTRRSIIDINTGGIISNNPNFSNILKGKEYTILGGDTDINTYCIWTEKSVINGKTQEIIAYISFEDIYNNKKCSLIKVSEGYQIFKIISRNISDNSGLPITWTQMKNNIKGNISNYFIWTQTDYKSNKLKVMGTQLNKNITNTILQIDLESTNINTLLFYVNEKHLWWNKQIGRKDNQGINIFFTAIK